VNISYALDDLIGATLTLYLLPFAGAESAIALALLVAFYPSRLNLSIDVATLPPILMISPMEQFELYTVSFFTSAIFFMIVASLLCLRALTLTSFSISGNWWAILNESLYHTLLAMTRDYIGPKYTALFPYLMGTTT